MANEKLEMEHETKIAELIEQNSWLEDANECLRNQLNKKEEEMQWYRGFKEAICMVFGGKKNGK
jgi:hypothetical protein